MRIETLAVHAGHRVDEASGAVSPSIQLSTTFERAADGSYPRGFIYSRSDNPNRQTLEEAMAALEGGAGRGVWLGPGRERGNMSGARSRRSTHRTGGSVSRRHQILARSSHSLGSGSHICRHDKSRRRGGGGRSAHEALLDRDASNPQLKITDLAGVARIAHAAGAVCVCDNTWAPIVQKPLDHGVDLIVHSTTKYIGGHCDVTGGVVIARADDASFSASG